MAARHTQLETGMTFSSQRDTSSWAIGELLLRQGLAKRLEGRLAINSFVVERDGGDSKEGLENVVLSSKLSLLDAGEASRRWQPAVSVLAGASVPTGASTFRDRTCCRSRSC